MFLFWIYSFLMTHGNIYVPEILKLNINNYTSIYSFITRWKPLNWIIKSHTTKYFVANISNKNRCHKLKFTRHNYHINVSTSWKFHKYWLINTNFTVKTLTWTIKCVIVYMWMIPHQVCKSEPLIWVTAIDFNKVQHLWSPVQVWVNSASHTSTTGSLQRFEMRHADIIVIPSSPIIEGSLCSIFHSVHYVAGCNNLDLNSRNSAFWNGKFIWNSKNAK